MNFTDKKIYELLPSYYRTRDDEMGKPLKALLEIIAEQARVAESNIGELYNNWFIETCKEWVVPYIGDLLGVRSLNTISGSSTVVSQRAYVANTLSYRRRKGIAPVLEQLSLDVAGWRAHVVEFFELIAATQYMNHIRIHRPACPDLRNMNQLDLTNSPFDTIAHTVDVRHINQQRGKYNIMNIGLFVWRLQNYPVALSDALNRPCLMSPPIPGVSFFTFDPTGIDVQLFNNPKTETSITHISTEVNVPGLLRRRALFDELESRRQALTDGATPSYLFFDDRDEIEGDDTTKQHPVFEIFPGSSNTPIPPEEVLICNLSNCCIPPVNKIYKQLQSDGTYLDVTKKITVAVDPVRGRFIFADNTITKARVSYSYGFSGDLGAGTYDRQDSIPEIFQTNTVWQAGVSKTITAIGSEEIYDTVKKAITEWNKKPEGTFGIITIMDSASYVADLDIDIKEKSRLLLIAAGWPVRDKSGGGQERVIADIAAGDLRPHIKGNINIKGIVLSGSPLTDDFDKKTGGEININGLLIEGKMTVRKGNLGALNVQNSTIIPGNGGLIVGAGISVNNPVKKLSNQWLAISLKRTICGPVLLNQTPVDALITEDCIIDTQQDNPAGYAVDCDSAPATFKTTTCFGKVIAKTIEAENCIFNNAVKAIRRQTGCIRFSYVPLTDPDAPVIKSETPRRYRCQPDLEIETETEAAEKNGAISQAQKDIIKDGVVSRLIPIFTSMQYGHHAYAQLSNACPLQINTGADNGSEMGAFYFLMQPQRTANLRIALDEYLRLGLEAGIFYST